MLQAAGVAHIKALHLHSALVSKRGTLGLSPLAQAPLDQAPLDHINHKWSHCQTCNTSQQVSHSACCSLSRMIVRTLSRPIEEMLK